MSDYIIRGMAADKQVRFFAANTKDLVEKARQIHNTSPIATAALGRLMTGTAMMGTMCKNDSDIVTVQIKGDGPMGGLVVTSDAKARVKGYGQTNLITGEIAEDLTYYFASSEQIPTSVALGVLMNKENTVRQAGGFMIQMMPFASDEVITALEERLKDFTSVTSHLDRGETPEDMMAELFEGMDMTIEDKISTEFYCNCSKERVSRAVVSVGKKELMDMIEEGKAIEVNCHFCNSHYNFSVEELKEMLKAAR